MFIISIQISPRSDRVLPYCNEAAELADATKDYEVRREKPEYEEEVETEQVRGRFQGDETLLCSLIALWF